MNLRQLLNAAYFLMIEHRDQKDRQKLDMELSNRPRVGLLGRPNTVEMVGRTRGDDALRALLGSPLMQANTPNRAPAPTSKVGRTQ